MQATIRQNIYAIAIISFCIGILYGIRAHAESATVTIDSTNSLIAGLDEESSCDKAKVAAQDHIDNAHLHLSFAKMEEAAGPDAMAKSSATLDQVNTVRQHRIVDLTTIQNDLASDTAKLKSSKLCANSTKDVLKQLDQASGQISAHVSDLAIAIKTSVKK